jgi:hypothetical protein
VDEAPHRRLAQVQVRAGQQRFRFSVLKQYGCKCAVCSIIPKGVRCDSRIFPPAR